MGCMRNKADCMSPGILSPWIECLDMPPEGTLAADRLHQDDRESIRSSTC